MIWAIGLSWKAPSGCVVEGGDGDDRFDVSGAGTGNFLYGGNDNDTFLFGNTTFDRSWVYCGPGWDNVSVSQNARPTMRDVHILGEGDVDVIDCSTVLFGNITIDGGDGGDTLKGGWWDDTIIGGPGPDKLYGGQGNDLLKAADSEGTDSVFGGGGNDTAWIDESGDGGFGEREVGADVETVVLFPVNG